MFVSNNPVYIYVHTSCQPPVVVAGGEAVSNQTESKSDNLVPQGNLPSFFTTGGFQMPSVGIPVDPALMSGLQMVSGQFLSTVPTPHPTTGGGDDHTHHWKQRESPSSSRGDNDSPQVVRVTNPRPTPIEHVATAGELLCE